MPSKIRQFQFRSPRNRTRLETLNIDADKFAQAVLDHAVESAEAGVCPVCKKPFDECEYFQRLERD